VAGLVDGFLGAAIVAEAALQKWKGGI